MFRKIRIAVLLLILVIVGGVTALDRYDTLQWKVPVAVALYPINADGGQISAQYIEGLDSSDFAILESFFAGEAQEYGLRLDRPIRVTLESPLSALPPMPPQSGNPLRVMAWSLRLRWWAWRITADSSGPPPTVRLFLLYHDPSRHEVLGHSTGLQKGKVGIVNLFSTRNMAGSNLTVIAHELLHTLGATDKYDLNSTQPAYPEGYAEPDLSPRHPQRFAELMAGRIPISASEAIIPESLAQVVIGSLTASEIGWFKEQSVD